MTTPPLDLDSMRAHAVAAENLKAGAHVTNAELLALLDRVDAAELWTVAHPCIVSHEQPYDFKWCEAHDRTFPLDGDCDHKGKSALDWQDAREQEQRVRALRAEDRAETAEAKVAAGLAFADMVEGIPGGMGHWKIADRVRTALGLVPIANQPPYQSLPTQALVSDHHTPATEES